MVSPSVTDLTALLSGIGFSSPAGTDFARLTEEQISTEQLLALQAEGRLSPRGTDELVKRQSEQQATSTVVGDTGQTTAIPPASPFITQGAGELNVPFGADFLAPTLGLQGLLAQLQEQQRQFNITQPAQVSQFGQTLAQQQGQFNTQSLFNAAQSLANLRAQGPQSAAELAFAQAGMGLPAIGGSAQNITGLLGAATRGATGQTVFEAGGQQVGIPNTLGGAQLSQLQGNPNLAGVLGSFAQASGNPDVFQRSISALLPSGFQGAGSGF